MTASGSVPTAGLYSQPMNRFAAVGATGVPIVVPDLCWKLFDHSVSEGFNVEVDVQEMRKCRIAASIMPLWSMSV